MTIMASMQAARGGMWEKSRGGKKKQEKRRQKSPVVFGSSQPHLRSSEDLSMYDSLARVPLY